MKKKLIASLIIGTFLISGLSFIGCNSSDNSTNQTSTTSDINSKKDSTAPEDTNTQQDKQGSSKDSNPENSSSSETAKKANENTETSKQKKDSNQTSDSSNSKEKSAKKEVSSSKATNSTSNPENKTNKNSNSNSEKKNSKQKTSNELSKKELANLIINKETNSNYKYITPVSPVGSGKNLSYEVDPNSNIFICSNTKFNKENLDDGLFVNFISFDNSTNSYSFIIKDAAMIKNGGNGTVDHGTISKDGKIKFE